MLIGLYNDLACHWKHWVYFTCVMSLCVQSWFLEREEQKSAFPMGAAFEAWYQMKLHTLQRDPDMPCWQTPSINVDKMHAFIHQSAREKCTILLLMSYFKKYHWRLHLKFKWKFISVWAYEEITCHFSQEAILHEARPMQMCLYMHMSTFD